MRREETIARIYILLLAFACLIAVAFCPRVVEANSEQGLRVGVEASAGGYQRRLTLIYNPYRQVDWSTCGQHKAQLHCHSTQSDDGEKSPDFVIDAYQSADFGILCITDHDQPDGEHDTKTTWPWMRWGREPSSLGMVAIQGCEVARNDYHVVSLYGGISSSASNSDDGWLTDIDSRGGSAFLCHPNLFTDCPLQPQTSNRSLSWYEDLLANHPSLLGLEVLTAAASSDAALSYNLELWDGVLTDIADRRHVWGFGSDDAHGYSWVGLGWNVVLVDELTDSAVRAALSSGQFYFSCRPWTNRTCPSVDSLVVDEIRGTISVRANNYTSIEWTSSGRVIGTGNCLRYVDNPNINRYVRLTLRNGDAWTCLQPIAFAAEIVPEVSRGGSSGWFVAVMITAACLLMGAMYIVVRPRASPGQ